MEPIKNRSECISFLCNLNIKVFFVWNVKLFFFRGEGFCNQILKWNLAESHSIGGATGYCQITEFLIHLKVYFAISHSNQYKVHLR